MTTPEKKAVRVAAATLKSARLTAKASKARLRALKSETKIQKQHYKWARKQVRAAKEALAQLEATAGAVDPAPAEPGMEADEASEAEPSPRRAKRKHAALAIERHTLNPVGPDRVPSPAAETEPSPAKAAGTAH